MKLDYLLYLWVCFRRQVQRKRFFYLPVGLNTPQDEPPLWDVESYDGDAHRTAISGSQSILLQIIPALLTWK
jgi:hypothetical protein